MDLPRFGLVSEGQRTGLREWNQEEGTWEQSMSAEDSPRPSPEILCLLGALNTLAQELAETRAELAKVNERMAMLDAAFPDGVSWGR